MHLNHISKARLHSLEVIGVGEGVGVGESGVPELGDEGAQLLAPMREEHAQQGCKEGQELVVVGQRGPRLEAAQYLAQQLLQLKEPQNQDW